MKQKALFFISFLLGFLACNNVPQTKNASVGVDAFETHYAGGFKVLQHDNYREVLVLNPWSASEVFARYYLVADDTTTTPADGMRIKVPIERLVITSPTHAGFLRELGVLDKVEGVCQPDLFYDPYLREQHVSGNIVDLGDAFRINVEKTMQLKVDLVMMSGYSQNDPYSQRLIHAGVPVVYNNEWMEGSLLARAEWIRFVALFVGKEEAADSIFSEVNTQFQTIRALGEKVESRPTVLTGSNFRGTWYMPGGGSFMAKLFADAGADYLYQNDSTRGSLPLHLETVIKNFAQTDVWLNCNFATITELLQSDAKHALFAPVAARRVYNFNRRLLPSGANDFWETAVVRPDWLLSDVMKVLHPELLLEHELIFTEQLKD